MEPTKEMINAANRLFPTYKTNALADIMKDAYLQGATDFAGWTDADMQAFAGQALKDVNNELSCADDLELFKQSKIKQP